MNNKTFFFNENTKKDVIKKHFKKKSNLVNNYIETITKMVSGNKIGYFQFLADSIFYKFYIMPKIYKVNEGECNGCEEYKKEFINFFKHYYRLINVYNINNYTDKLGGNISDLGYKSNSKKNMFAYADVEDIDDFIIHNYMDALRVLQNFFTKHKKQMFLEQEFKSQSIKHKLNLKKNILNPDKSYIHQTKKTPLIYSDIALISTVVLKEFLNKKIRNFSNTYKALQIKKELNQLSSFLKKRFPDNKQDFNIKDLLSRGISKKFEKNNDYRNVYKALLKLASKEHYYNGDTFLELEKEENTISLFFQPEKLYEWIVYDILVKNNEFEEVLKDEKDNIVKHYFLEPSITKKYESLPDLIVKKDNKIYPMDAKWKILNKKTSSFDNDLFKLRRDAMIRGSNKGYLVYPKSENTDFSFDKEYNYSFDKEFKFELKIINIPTL